MGNQLSQWLNLSAWYAWQVHRKHNQRKVSPFPSFSYETGRNRMADSVYWLLPLDCFLLLELFCAFLWLSFSLLLFTTKEKPGQVLLKSFFLPRSDCLLGSELNLKLWERSLRLSSRDKASALYIMYVMRASLPPKFDFWSDWDWRPRLRIETR